MIGKSGREISWANVKFAGAVVLATACGYGAASYAEAPTARPPIAFTSLLATSKTVMDEPIVYPAGEAELTAGMMAMNPGQTAGFGIWH